MNSKSRMSKMFPFHRYRANTLLDVDYPLVAYCAEEVRRQRDTPWHVWRMYEAWMFAIERWNESELLTHAIVTEVGKKMDEENYMGYRDGNVFIGDQMKSYPEAIHGEMTTLLDAINEGAVSAIQAYARFEEIHPFFDGNGRTGKVIYNWVNNSLLTPVWPVDLYGGIDNP